jgi:hypothetical protein
MFQDSGHFHRNSANPNSDEIVRISTIVAGIRWESSKSYVPTGQLWNLVTFDFILFYINIYILWIKINFYKLIWFNENIKNIYDFSYAPNIRKILLTKNSFLKNNFPKTILRWELFSVKQIEHQKILILFYLYELFDLMLYLLKENIRVCEGIN